MSAGEETETTFRSDTVILKEGEMWGRRMSDINRYVDGDGKVEIKFIIYHLDLKMWKNLILYTVNSQQVQIVQSWVKIIQNSNTKA